MAPVPTKSKKQPRQTRPTMVSSDNVYDGFGRSLSSLQRMQSYKERTQDKNTTIARQHASQNESNNNTLTYRDVFPGRKYKLTLSDTSWMGEENVVTVGYTNNGTFIELYSTSEAPENNVFDIDLSNSNIVSIDTLEIRLVGATKSVRSYIEDNTTSGSLSGAIIRLIDSVADLISGQETINEKLDDLDRRVTALEEGQ